MARNLVIAACARSGTRYTAHTLRAYGYRCGQEKIYGPTFSHEKVINPFENSGYEMDVSWLAVPHLERIVRYADIYHQVRHPLKVVSSLLGLGLFHKDHNMLWKGPALTNMPNVSKLNEKEKCICYWVTWNHKIEQYATERFKIEEFTRDHKTVLDLLRLGSEGITEPAKIPTDINSRSKGPTVQWEDVSGPYAEQFFELAEKYGYR